MAMRPISSSSRQHPLVSLLALVGLALLLLPLISLFFGGLPDAENLDAAPLWRSLGVSISASLIALILGFPLAWWLARTRSPWRILVRALVAIPMVLPPLVSGIALLGAFGRGGMLGLDLAFTDAALVMAAAFVAAPFFVLSAEAALRGLNPRYEEVAATLGAGRWMILMRVIFPQARPVLFAGMLLTFARALGEFGATVTFAGNFESRRTLPLEIFHQLEMRGDFAASVATAQVLLVLALLLVIGLSLLNRSPAPVSDFGNDKGRA